MRSHLSQVQRFFYSHYLYGGIRQSVGVLLPALLLSAAGWYAIGFVAAVGAACLAILDQPGGPRRYGINGMLAALLLGSATVAVTGLASGHPLAIWVVIPLLCFGFAMLNTFGKQGGLLGFACLLIMTLTMRTPLHWSDVLQHTLISFTGGMFYLGYSAAVRRLMWHKEAQQALSVALFSTADYMATRACFYDVQISLKESYRTLIQRQAAMTNAHQIARDIVLRELPRGGATQADRERQILFNRFTDMIALLDGMLATHTDYATLRRRLPDSDILLFARDALNKLSNNVAGIALNVARNRHIRVRNSVKAELRALEFELQQLREQDMPRQEPELYALLVRVLRRLRNMARLVDRMADPARPAKGTSTDNLRADKSLNRFLTRQEWRLGMLTSNLNAQSVHFRYALRVAVATILALGVASVLPHLPFVESLDPGMGSHSYWIILTVLIIMKPGFTLTRQRNGWRLTGTLIGCAVALLLFSLIRNQYVFIGLLVACSILGYSLVQVNYTLSAMFNTIFVLLAFHLLAPGSTSVVGERLTDTIIGSVLALSCSYILPSWERNTVLPLARSLREASLDFLYKGLGWVDAARALRFPASDGTVDPQADPGLETAHSEYQRTAAAPPGKNGPRNADMARPSAEAAQHFMDGHADGSGNKSATPEMLLEDADLQWRLSRQNLHFTFSNFANALYRMMDEPVRRQRHVPELIRLLAQHHSLASQMTAVIPELAPMDRTPAGIRRALDATADYLNGRDADPPNVIDPEGHHAELAYPLRQMIKAAKGIRDEMRAISPRPSANSATTSQSPETRTAE